MGSNQGNQILHSALTLANSPFLEGACHHFPMFCSHVYYDFLLASSLTSTLHNHLLFFVLVNTFCVLPEESEEEYLLGTKISKSYCFCFFPKQVQHFSMGYYSYSEWDILAQACTLHGRIFTYIHA